MGFRLSAGERCLSGRLFFLDGGHFSRWVLAALCTVVSVLKALTSHLSADGRPAHTDRLGSAGKAHSRLTAGRQELWEDPVPEGQGELWSRVEGVGRVARWQRSNG